MKFIFIFVSLCVFLGANAAHPGYTKAGRRALILPFVGASAFKTGGKDLPDGSQAPDLLKDAANWRLGYMLSRLTGGELLGALVNVEKKLKSHSSMCSDEIDIWRAVQAVMLRYRDSPYCLDYNVEGKPRVICCYVRVLGTNKGFCAYYDLVQATLPPPQLSPCFKRDVVTVHVFLIRNIIDMDLQAEICETKNFYNPCELVCCDKFKTAPFCTKPIECYS